MSEDISDVAVSILYWGCITFVGLLFFHTYALSDDVIMSGFSVAGSVVFVGGLYYLFKAIDKYKELQEIKK